MTFQLQYRTSLRVYSHVPLKSPFFSPFKNGLNVLIWYFLLTKMVTLTVHVNKVLSFNWTSKAQFYLPTTVPKSTVPERFAPAAWTLRHTPGSSSAQSLPSPFVLRQHSPPSNESAKKTLYLNEKKMLKPPAN